MSRRRHLEQGSLFALSLLPLMMAASGAAAQALPSGGVVTSGAAAIGYTSASDMTVTQTSGKAIINWADFSIGQGKSVTFENGTGATLNRVTGANVSNLMGALNASGSVYLINPNGVIIGSTGVVNVGGSFVASTLNVTDANFLAGGDLTFAGASTAAVKNLGKIGALGGDVALVAATVTNEGAITAGGTAALAAGAKVLIRDANTDDGRFLVEVGAGDVTNAGAILATEAELRANGGNVYALAGNTGDTINAGYSNNSGGGGDLSLSKKSDNFSGRVFLTAGTGNVTSSGTITAGDTVTMRGAQVAIAGTHVEANRWAIDADSFTIGDAEATALNGSMAYGSYNPETQEYNYGGASVGIVARTGDIVLDTNAVGLNIANRALDLTAFGNVTFHDAVSATRTFVYPWGTYENTGSFYLRADSAGTGTGVVSGVSLNQGRASIITNAADYSAYDTLLADLHAANPNASVDLTMLVNTYADLKRIATDNHGADAQGNFLLSHDIDAAASVDGGYVGAVLAGRFDGADHTISNLRVTAADAGLFSGLRGAEVSGLNFSGGSVTGTQTAGALAGWASNANINGVTSSMDVSNSGSGTGGLIGLATSTSIYGATVSGDVTGAGKVGGIVGHATDGYVQSAAFSGAVTGVDKVGGVVGQAERTSIYYAVVTGSVAGQNQTGGLVGQYLGDQNSTVRASEVSATVTGDSETGGLIGYLDAGHLIGSVFSGSVVGGDNTGGAVGQAENGNGVTYNPWQSHQIESVDVSGSVSGRDSTGGLVGHMGSQTGIAYATSSAVVTGVNLVGGAVGSNSATTFMAVSASGAVTASGYHVGGLVGSNSGTIDNSQASGNVLGSGGVGGLAGYSTGSISYSSASGNVTGRELQVNDEWVQTAVGGLVGQDYYGNINYGSATGVVSGHGAYFGGLVGYIYGASIQSSFATGAVTGLHQVGGLVGNAGNLSVSNSYATGAVTGGDYDGQYGIGDEATATGGLLGFSRDSIQINGSYATGKVVGANNTGGLIGMLGPRSNTQLQDSWASGDVVGDDNVGGLIGAITPNYYASASLYNTYASGKVTGATGVGGLVGLIQGQSYYDAADDETYTAAVTISDSYAGGAVSGDHAVGGLVGEVNQGIINIANVYETGSATGLGSVGGLIGYMHSGVTISDGYATGAVSGDSEVGGLFGHYAGSLVSNLYWDTDSSGTVISRGNDVANLADTTGLTREQAFDADSYTFSDNSHWAFINGVRPLLASEWSGTINNAHQLQLVALHADLNYALVRDISAAETGVAGSGVFQNGFSSISSLSGSLDGQGHKISGLTISHASNDTDAAGLFRVIQNTGSVFDLALVGGSLTATGASSAGAIAGFNNGRVESVSSTMSVTGGAAANTYTGGLVGINNTGGQVLSSASKGVVIGGIAGGVAGGNSGLIQNSYASGSVAGASKVGGIVGLNVDGTVDTVLNTSLVTGNGAVGALVGVSTGGAVVNGRWSTTINGDIAAIGDSGETATDNNLGYSTADLQDETKTDAVYAGFDLYNVWALGSGAAASGDGVAHFAELYRADNILVVDARTNGTYGDDSFGGNYAVRGYLRGGDALNVNIDDSAFGATTHVGVYQMGVQATLTGGGSYRVVKLGTLTIGKRQVYVNLNGGVTKTYDGTNTAVLTNDAFNQYNVVNGDSLTITGTGTYAASGVGSGVTVTAGDLVLGGANAGDYEVVTEGALVRDVGYINHAMVTGTVTSTKTYDGTTTLGADATTGLTGLVGDETLAATFTNVAYADKNAGANKGLTGGVSVDLSGATGANYAVTSFNVAGTGRIDAKTIAASLSGTIIKTYDGTTTATAGDNLALSGLVSGDTVTVGAGGATYADKNAGAGKTVTVNGMTLGGADAGNYVLATNTASADIGQINAKVITAGLSGAVTKTYDGTTTATLGDNLALSGLVSGDRVTVGAGGAAYADKNAGAGKTVTVNGVTIGGADAGNYVLATNTASADIGQISQKALTITADGQVKNRNDADPVLTYLSTGLVTGDTLTGGLTREAGETVGTYGILQGTLSGGGNYVVTFNRALLTINLGIPPVEDLIIPYIPADGGGSTASGGSTGGGGAGGQADGGTSAGYQLAVQDGGGQPQSQQQQGGDDTTSCAAGEACQSAPYTQGGSTSGAIHFQGFQ